MLVMCSPVSPKARSEWPCMHSQRVLREFRTHSQQLLVAQATAQHVRQDGRAWRPSDGSFVTPRGQRIGASVRALLMCSHWAMQGGW